MQVGAQWCLAVLQPSGPPATLSLITNLRLTQRRHLLGGASAWTPVQPVMLVSKQSPLF